MTSYGYARVSTGEQTPQLQLDALAAAGCDLVLTETASGKNREGRPVLAALLDRVTAGDVLVVWGLDRLGRDALDLLTIMRDLAAKGVTLQSLHDHIDNSTAAGKMLSTVTAAVSQMERERTLERIHAGIAAARQRPGYRHGRPPKLSAAQVDEALRQRSEGIPQRTTARAMGVSRQALARSLAAADARRQVALTPV